MLDLNDVLRLFSERFAKTAFRLEVLPAYAVDSDGGDVARYLAGEPEPDPDRKGPFLEVLRGERAAGKLRHRVRVLTTPLGDYLRYECEWGYVPNVEAGEQIKILDLSEIDRPADLVDEEFWLLDNEVAIRMFYDAAGAFIGAELADDPEPYRRARGAAEAAAEDFTSWWARHPEEWRENRQNATR